MKLFSGSAHPELADNIAKHLGAEIGKIERRRFSDGEYWVKYQENIRGHDVFLLQPTHPPADHLLELLIMIDAARRASAARITVVIPYFGYARQDRKDKPRVAITARLIANLLQAASADRILTMDLHTAQLQGFFDIPVDHLYSSYIYVEHFRRIAGNDLVVVSPDVGGIAMARSYAQKLSASIAFIDKRRSEHNEAEVMNIIGEVKDKRVLIIDDIVDTAGTITKACVRLKELGCGPIHIACTHPILSGPAIKRIKKVDIEEFVVSDTVPLHNSAKDSKQFTVLSMAKVFGEAIRRIHYGESLSYLFL
ncbi:MAG: ribose-phosphate pyrophosphokinase [Candidatus Hatepunaea meridiana]|nr:ribose-phosphate pyrophosphokinase [Candidatus Hatepunaea meridiana]